MGFTSEGKLIRPSGRKNNELREVQLFSNYIGNAEGSCLVKFGDTHVLCTASVEEKVPIFMKNSGKGWVTAEYGMLPRSTHTRTSREASRGKQSGRTLEIQRLIGRSLRSIIDLKLLGERQIIIDCDVIQADGGTRTASITGGWVALSCAINRLLYTNKLKTNPIINQICAISCGIWKGFPILDLDYSEDSTAEVDSNFVFTLDGKLVEIQASSEADPFERTKMDMLLDLALEGTKVLFEKQMKAVNEA